ncbi:MAG: hypothetical protein Q9191_005446 [Dirinaria sp. TL-2023a]
MAFVTPTKGMAIRPGQYVSGEGRVYHPYLAEWREDRSNLTQLVSILQAIFAREPPLIAKQSQPPQAQLQSIQNGTPPPVPPLPPELDKFPPTAAPFNPRPPPPPPKAYDTQSESPRPQLNSPHGFPPRPPKPSGGYGVENTGQSSGYGISEQQPSQGQPQRTLSQRYIVHDHGLHLLYPTAHQEETPAKDLGNSKFRIGSSSSSNNFQPNSLLQITLNHLHLTCSTGSNS